jgi:hypothetical protein
MRKWPSSFDQFVGAAEKCKGNVDPKRFRGPEIDDEFNFRKLTPVRLPLGWLRLETRPILTGSPPRVNWIGILTVCDGEEVRRRQTLRKTVEIRSCLPVVASAPR